jgi:hypothetical protein
MHGHFPNNPRPPLILAYGFTHSFNYLRQSAKTPYGQTLAAFLPKIIKSIRQYKMGGWDRKPQLRNNSKMPFYEAEHRRRVWINRA